MNSAIRPTPATRGPAKARRQVGAVMLAGCLLIAGCSDDASSEHPAQPTVVDVPAIVRKVEPSVVMITTDAGLGSGVVWSADGVVVTNAHVVGSATDVRVTFADGSRSAAKVLATDTITDIAIVRTELGGLTPASFTTVLPEQGAPAIAIGSPLGFSNSVTTGVVSGLGRAIPGSAAQGQSLVDLLQTDAAISPGNSGGALVDGDGKVIGIVDAYIPPTQGAVSIGFAIPAYTVVDVVQQLLVDGTADHPFVGVVPGTVTPELQDRLGLPVDHGAVVYDLSIPGPASDAGIQRGDVIVRFGARDVADAEDLLAALRDHTPGDQVDTVVETGTGRKTVKITLAERPT